MSISLGTLHRAARVAIKRNGPLVTSVAAGVGVGVTAYLVGRASFRAAELIQEDEMTGGVSDDPHQRLKERTKLVWREYIPAAASAGGTIVFIVASHRLATSKALAAQAALAVTERAYAEYREKLIETPGGQRQDQSIRDGIAQDRVRDNPPPKNAEILVVGPGVVLCHEAFTGRYFAQSMEGLRKAENEVNAKAIRNDYATLDDFYQRTGLRITSNSGELGWVPDRPMELMFSSVISEDGRPALSFEYSYIQSIP